MAPTSSVHWFTFDEISAPIPTEPRMRSANRIAIRNSGDSEASGATHCTSRNSSIARPRPISTRLSAKGSAETKIA